MLEFYLTIIFTALPAILLLIVLANTKKLRWLLFFVAPIVLVSTAMSFTLIEKIKSMPTMNLPDKFILVGKLEAKPNIFMWVVEPNNKYPTTITIPWSEGKARELAKAESEMKAGRILGRDKNREQNPVPGEFAIHNLNADYTVRKDD
jgi:hypothetical protein